MKIFVIRILYYNAVYAKFLFPAFLVRKGIPFNKRRNHFIAECNVFANGNIYDSMRISCDLSVK